MCIFTDNCKYWIFDTWEEADTFGASRKVLSGSQYVFGIKYGTYIGKYVYIEDIR